VPTVRLRRASEYPPSAQKAFELSKSWFNHDFTEPPAMSRVMAWDQMFSSYTKIADTLQLEPDMGQIAPVDPTPAPGGPSGA
jgi:hypothetical protein